MSRFGGHTRLGHNFGEVGGMDGARRVEAVLMSVHEATNTYSIIIAIRPPCVEQGANTRSWRLWIRYSSRESELRRIQPRCSGIGPTPCEAG
jgi:hypothetical protein